MHAPRMSIATREDQGCYGLRYQYLFGGSLPRQKNAVASEYYSRVQRLFSSRGRVAECVEMGGGRRVYRLFPRRFVVAFPFCAKPKGMCLVMLLVPWKNRRSFPLSTEGCFLGMAVLIGRRMEGRTCAPRTQPVTHSPKERRSVLTSHNKMHTSKTNPVGKVARA